MKWKITEVSDDDPEATWTDNELLGVSILLTHHTGTPYNDSNVYWRAREQMQPMAQIVLARAHAPSE